MAEQRMVAAVELVFPPQPVANAVKVLSDPNARLVVLELHTPCGINFYFMDPASAEKVSADIAQHARTARSNIVIAGGG